MEPSHLLTGSVRCTVMDSIDSTSQAMFACYVYPGHRQRPVSQNQTGDTSKSLHFRLHTQSAHAPCAQTFAPGISSSFDPFHHSASCISSVSNVHSDVSPERRVPEGRELTTNQPFQHNQFPEDTAVINAEVQSELGGEGLHPSPAYAQCARLLKAEIDGHIASNFDVSCCNWEQIRQLIVKTSVDVDENAAFVASMVGTLEETAILAFFEQVLQPGDTSQFCETCLKLFIMPLFAKLSLKQTASRFFMSVMEKIAVSHPQALTQIVVVPTAMLPDLKTSQSQVILLLIKAGLPATSLLTLLCCLLQSNVSWNDAHVSIVQGLLDKSLPLTSRTLDAVVDALATQVRQLGTSVNFSRLLLTFLTKHGAQLTSSHVDGIHIVVTHTSTFMSKTLIGHVCRWKQHKSL